MKTAALFAAAVLLATAVMNARATALDKKPASGAPDTALSRNSLGRKMAAEGGMHDASTLGKTGLPGYSYEDDHHILVDINTLRTFGLIGEDFRHVNEATEDTPCMTEAQCSKKKLVCSKKCSKEVEELHPSAAKCTLRCKKCVPTC